MYVSVVWYNDHEIFGFPNPFEAATEIRWLFSETIAVIRRDGANICAPKFFNNGINAVPINS